MRLTLPSLRQALGLLAAVTTVVLVVVLSSIGTSNTARPQYDHYVAMGDSFTAAPYVPITDIARGCYRSRNNYPHLLADAMRIEELQDRSCTGARTDHLDDRQRTRIGGRVPPQFDALSERTDLVTLGIGANNGRLYAKLASACRRTQAVCPLHERRAELRGLVDQVGPTLVETLGEVRELAPNARVLLVGYPKLLPQRGSCDILPNFRPQDRATFRGVNRQLREEMRGAAEEAGVEFVDFYRASIGHDICSRRPWVQGRYGNGRKGAALHPLPAGQAVLARIIETVLRTEPPETGEGS